ncbi:hypothetical protein D3C77_761480 [compost metagenome]
MVTSRRYVAAIRLSVVCIDQKIVEARYFKIKAWTDQIINPVMATVGIIPVPFNGGG